MEIEGRISQLLPVQSGISTRTGSPWTSQEFILEYFWWPNQTFPTRLSTRVFGEERIKQYNLQVGDEVKIRYHIEGHEVNGRWFNEVRLDGIVFVGASVAKNPQPGGQPSTTIAKTVQEAPQEAIQREEKDDDLPF